MNQLRLTGLLAVIFVLSFIGAQVNLGVFVTVLLGKAWLTNR